MRQQLILPWRDAGCEYRRKHFEYLHDFYSREFDVVVGDNEGDFNRSGARNAGVAQSNSEVAVIVDADNYIPIDQIKLAVKYARRRRGLVKPSKFFGYLTEQATHQFYENDAIVKSDNMYMNAPVMDFSGGAYVIRKDIYQDIGGFDEGFVGYGAEDDAFHALCTRKLGSISYVGGMNYHLYHPAYRVTSRENYQRLVDKYNFNKSRVHKILRNTP
jgi:predicted glycosyltransferase involved in capsule biosynthesis